MRIALLSMCERRRSTLLNRLGEVEIDGFRSTIRLLLMSIALRYAACGSMHDGKHFAREFRRIFSEAPYE